MAGILFLISEVWKQIHINLVLQAAGPGAYYWWAFPFQLCSMPLYVCLMIPFSGKRLKDSLLTFLATYGLLAGVFTFFDTSGFYEFGSLPLAIHSWVWHICMVLLGIFSFALLCGTKRPDFFGATLVFLSGCLIAELINLLVGDRAIINMYYINPRLKMNQLVFKSIVDYAGNGWAILSYILCIMLGALIVYIPLLLTEKN